MRMLVNCIELNIATMHKEVKETNCFDVEWVSETKMNLFVFCAQVDSSI